jgi:hypothetical protein
MSEVEELSEGIIFTYLLAFLFVYDLDVFTILIGMSPDGLQSLYQETGAPLHSAYALPQLLAFYNNNANQSIMSQVHRYGKP